MINYDNKTGIPDLNSIEKEINNISENYKPSDAIMAGKEYFSPIMKGIAEDGGKRFREFFGGVNQFLQAPQGAREASPENRLSNTLSEIGRLGGQYETNLANREFIDTRAENLGVLANQDIQARYNMLTDTFKRNYERLEGDKDRRAFIEQTQREIQQQMTVNANELRKLELLDKQFGLDGEMQQHKIWLDKEMLALDRARLAISREVNQPRPSIVSIENSRTNIPSQSSTPIQPSPLVSWATNPATRQTARGGF